jgi:hypothetical protein
MNEAPVIGAKTGTRPVALADASTRIEHVTALLVLTLLTLVLRLHGLDSALPHMLDQDSNVVLQVQHLRDGRWNKRVERDYPAYPLLTAHVTRAWSAPPPELASSSDGTLEQHLAAASADHLHVRTTVAWISVLIVPATFMIARAIVGPSWALLASALVAFSLLTHTLGQQARPHAVHAALATLTIAACVRLTERRGWGDYALAGAALFLGLGSLNNGIALFLPLVAAHVLGRGRASKGKMSVALLIGLAALPVLYPFLFENWGIQSEAEAGTWSLSSHEFRLDSFDGGGFATIVDALMSYEPMLLGLVVAALLVFLSKVLLERRFAPGKAGLVVLSYGVPYLAVLSMYGQNRDRFLLPALPVLAVFAVWAAANLAARVRSSTPRHLVVAIAIASPLIGALATARLSLIRARPDTLSEAAAWVATHADGDSIFLSPRPDWKHQMSSIDLPLGRTAAGLARPGGPKVDGYNVWSLYQRRLSDKRGPEPRFDLHWAFLSARDIESFAGTRSEFLDSDSRGYFVSTGPGLYVLEVCEGQDNPDLNGLRAALQTVGSLEARFSPDVDPHRTDLPLTYRDQLQQLPDRPNLTRRILRARAVGPVVEIYRVTTVGLNRKAGAR